MACFFIIYSEQVTMLIITTQWDGLRTDNWKLIQNTLSW
jgi:hypothetical protein